jgi:hypothetical protein
LPIKIITYSKFSTSKDETSAEKSILYSVDFCFLKLKFEMTLITHKKGLVNQSSFLPETDEKTKRMESKIGRQG